LRADERPVFVGADTQPKELRRVEGIVLLHEPLDAASVGPALRPVDQAAGHSVDQQRPRWKPRVVGNRRRGLKAAAPERTSDSEGQSCPQEDHKGTRILSDPSTQVPDCLSGGPITTGWVEHASRV